MKNLSINPLATELFFRRLFRENLRQAPIVYRLIDLAALGDFYLRSLLILDRNFGQAVLYGRYKG